MAPQESPIAPGGTHFFSSLHEESTQDETIPKWNQNSVSGGSTIQTSKFNSPTPDPEVHRPRDSIEQLRDEYTPPIPSFGSASQEASANQNGHPARNRATMSKQVDKEPSSSTLVNISLTVNSKPPHPTVHDFVDSRGSANSAVPNLNESAPLLLTFMEDYENATRKIDQLLKRLDIPITATAKLSEKLDLIADSMT